MGERGRRHGGARGLGYRSEVGGAFARLRELAAGEEGARAGRRIGIGRTNGAAEADICTRCTLLCMRTTLDLDDAVIRQAKRAVQEKA